MIYLVSMAVAVWLLGMVPAKYGLRQNNYKNYLILAGCVVVLITGLRTPFTGSSDTYRYTVAFDSMAGYEKFGLYYESALADEDFLLSETGFYFCTWLLTRLFNDSQWIILISMMFSTYAVCCFAHKNSQDPPMVLLMYVCLGLLTFNMNGMRQAMAMSVCLFAFEHAKKQKLIPFILTILLAMQFHKTAICFAPVYVLPLLKKGQGTTFLYFGLMIVAVFAVDWFIETYNAFTGESYDLDGEASGGGVTVVVTYVLALLMILFVSKKLDSKIAQVAFWGAMLGLAFYLTRYLSNRIMERISYYYFYFVMLLIPEALMAWNPKERILIKIGICVFAILLLWYRIRIGNFANYTLFFL